VFGGGGFEELKDDDEDLGECVWLYEIDHPTYRTLRSEVSRWMEAFDFEPRLPSAPRRIWLDDVCYAILLLAMGELPADVVHVADEELAEALTAWIVKYLWPIVEAVRDVGDRWQCLFHEREDEYEPEWPQVHAIGFARALSSMVMNDFVFDLRLKVEAQIQCAERRADDVVQPDLFQADTEINGVLNPW
jgi:hypothetical protein